MGKNDFLIMGFTFAPAFEANIERMPVPHPTSSTIFPRNRCGLLMIAFLQTQGQNRKKQTV